MPGLVLFGRRWQIGSDDLVIPSFLDLVIRLVWLIVAIVIYWKNELHYNCTGGYYIKFYFFGLFALSHAIIIIDCLLVQSSRCGSIMETEARKYVPLFLYFRILAGAIYIGWNILGVVWISQDMFICPEVPSALSYIECIVVFNLTLLAIQILLLIYCFDPLGSSNTDFQAFETAGDEFSIFNIPIGISPHTRRWEKRCRRYCCACGANDEEKEAFREIGKIFGSQLSEDLVSSDIIAGLYLMNLQNKQERSQFKSVTVINDNVQKVVSQEPSRFTLSSSLYDLDDNWDSPKYLFQFVKYACAAYGWIFVPPKRLWNSCVCCSCLPKRNYRYLQKIEGDNCCLWCTSGVKDLNRLEFEDIVHVTFHNKLFENPFFVAIDHKTNSVVISIRGTLSLHDVIMDMTGWPVQIPGYPESFKAHHGMLKGALNIKSKLDELQILPKLMEENPGYNLVVTGQSLGAGLATVLSLLLRLEYPNLKCYAYSPPGGLLSRDGAEYCSDFLTSVIYGDDFVSRLGLLQFERLKFRMINALQNCKVPKYRILLRGMLCCSAAPTSYVGSDGNFNNDWSTSAGQVPQTEESVTTYVNSDAISDDSVTRLKANDEITCDTTKYSQAHPKTNYPSLDGMYPPGKIFYITEIPRREAKSKSSTSKWNWRWADRTEFDDIIISNKMIWDHIPLKMPKSLRYLARKEK